MSKKNDRTIYILYVPGGAMHGIIPAVILSRLEELAETPSANLFQVLNGVSTGSIIVGGLSIRTDTDATKPKFVAHDSVELFCRYGPKFFPKITGRIAKYMTASILNFFQDKTDPAQIERFLIRDIREKCRLLCEANKNNSAIVREVIAIRKLATPRYIRPKYRKRASTSCEALQARTDISPETNAMLQTLNTMILARKARGTLTSTFNSVVFKGMDLVKQTWAHDYLYDPKIAEQTLKSYLGDTRMSDSLKSVYISTLDLENRRMVTFFSRKKDFFSNDPETPSDTSAGNEKIWDAIMASIANPFAYPPHRTESGVLCSDRAPVHTPLPCVEDVLRHKPQDAKVKLIYVGTGRHRINHENERYINYGVPGNLMDGRELDDLAQYTGTTAQEILEQKLGKDGFIEINPYISPEKWEDEQRMPARDPLDATPDSIKRLLAFSMDFIQQEETDKALKALALEMSENLYNLGQMSEEKYKRIRKRCLPDDQNDPANDNKNDNEDSDIARTTSQIIRNIIPKRFQFF